MRRRQTERFDTTLQKNRAVHWCMPEISQEHNRGEEVSCRGGQVFLNRPGTQNTRMQLPRDSTAVMLAGSREQGTRGVFRPE